MVTSKILYQKFEGKRNVHIWVPDYISKSRRMQFYNLLKAAALPFQHTQISNERLLSHQIQMTAFLPQMFLILHVK